MDPLELQAMFPRLKQWYGPTQIAKFGNLPQFWQDLEQWSCLRSVLRAFENDAQRSTHNQHDNSRNNNYVSFPPPPSHPHPSSARCCVWKDLPPALHETDSVVDALPLTQRRLMLARLRFEDATVKLNNVAHLAQLAERDPRRSPSPDPVYNAQGKRTNTREVRMRARFADDKRLFLDEMLRLRPLPSSSAVMMASTAGAPQQQQQIRRKIYIPVKDFPGRNFIGLIIGPRGDTQKQLERETGCKIAIRGKGSVKSGRQGAVTKTEDENDELHVVVTGDSEQGVDKASDMVERLLRPLDDAENEHKQKQLRDLAVYNGTLRETEMCAYCQERGHKQWECPRKRAAEAAQSGGGMGSSANAAPLGRAAANTWTGQVVCRHCGERSHPSSDCPLLRGGGGMQHLRQQQPPPPQQQQQEPQVDQTEFDDFWDSLNPDAASAKAPAPAPAQPYYPAPLGAPPPPHLHYPLPPPPPQQHVYAPPPPPPAEMPPPSYPPMPPPMPPPPPPAFPEPPPMPPKRR